MVFSTKETFTLQIAFYACLPGTVLVHLKVLLQNFLGEKNGIDQESLMGEI